MSLWMDTADEGEVFCGIIWALFVSVFLLGWVCLSPVLAQMFREKKVSICLGGEMLKRLNEARRNTTFKRVVGKYDKKFEFCRCLLYWERDLEYDSWNRKKTDRRLTLSAKLCVEFL